MLQPARELIRAAREEMERGENLLEHQDEEGARYAFNRALDVLLSVEGGAESNPEIRPVYRELVGRIHSLELKGVDVDRVEESLWHEELDSSIDLVDLESEGASSSTSIPTVGESFDLPIDYNERVDAIVRMFQQERRDWFQAALNRSGLYIEHAREVFREEGLPEDLAYLAMVESAFKARAISRAGARGIWQFIDGTGRRYGLLGDYWVDERFDPEKSTRAAALHLKDLHQEFGDWNLVMAAYNGGPNRVKQAMARTGASDFWEIARTRHLRRETRSYVPLIHGAIIIAKNPARYGFGTGLEPPWRFDVVEIDSPMDLGTAADCAGTSLAVMKELNPELLRWVTPLNRPRYSLRIPPGSSQAFREALEAIPPEERVRFVSYTVERGDTLSHIARRFATSVNALAEANHIRLSSVIRPGQVLTVPVPAGTLPRERPVPPVGTASADSGGGVYVVQPGDTLSEIAEAQGVSLTRLRSWNGLGRRSLIHPGQKLMIYGKDGSASQARVVYQVRRGDTLSTIARRFGVRVQQIREWNHLSHDRILAGKSLEIYTSSPSP